MYLGRIVEDRRRPTRSGPVRATPTPRRWWRRSRAPTAAGYCRPTCPATYPTRPARRPAAGSTRAARVARDELRRTRPAAGPRWPAARSPATSALRCPTAPAPPGNREPRRYVVGQRARRRRAVRRRAARPRGRDRPRRHRRPGRRRAPPGLPDGQVDRRGGPLAAARADLLPHPPVGGVPVRRTDEAENPALTAYRSAARASEALRAGITTIRCVHEQNRADLLLRAAVRRGWISAPRILGAGRAVSDRGRPRRGVGLRVRQRGAGVLRGGAGRARRGRRPCEDLHQRRPGQRGRAVERPEMTDGEIRGAVRAAGRARHLRRRPLWRVGRDPAGPGPGGALLRARLPAGRRDRRAARPSGRLRHPDPVRNPLGVVDAGPRVRRALDPATPAERCRRAPGQHPARDPGRRHPASTAPTYPPGDLVDGVPAAVHELLLMAAAGLSPLLSLQSVSVNAAALLGHRAITSGRSGPATRPTSSPLPPIRWTIWPRCATISLVVHGGRVIRADAA